MTIVDSGAMENIDFKRELSELYQQTDQEVSLVDVPELNYSMIDGHGDPNTSPEYEAAIETLYPFSYAIRAIIKDEEEFKYVVMPLEGLWWTDDMESFDVENKSDWQWTLMIMQPDFVTEPIVERARENIRENKKICRPYRTYGSNPSTRERPHKRSTSVRFLRKDRPSSGFTSSLTLEAILSAVDIMRYTSVICAEPTPNA